VLDGYGPLPSELPYDGSSEPCASLMFFLRRHDKNAANIMARTAIGIATPIATDVPLVLFSGNLTAGAAELLGEAERVEDGDEIAEVKVKSSGIWAMTVAAGVMRNIFVGVLQHSNELTPLPPGSQQLVSR